MARKLINQVFTPRRHDVNETMYVGRPTLEKSLLRAVEGSQHVLLCGESGNGKSWLYRRVLYGKHHFVAANCANAGRANSITQEIVRIAQPLGKPTKTSYTQNGSAGLSMFGGTASIGQTGTYSVQQEEPLLAAFRQIAEQSPTALTVVVLENLESIFEHSSLMSELAQIILLLDDPCYAQYNVKLLIVGTPNGVIDYFSKTKNLESVANRIYELPKVGGFTDREVGELVRKGFVSELGVRLDDDDVLFITDHIFNLTMGVAQRVHEYCEQLAFRIEDNNWVYSRDLLVVADHHWLNAGLRQSYVVLEQKLNSRDTAVSRRNQVIYAVGKTRTHQFETSIIEGIIRREFPSAVSVKNMGISTILTELSADPDPLLVRNNKTSQYRIRDPRYIMCIRTALYKDQNSGKVRKKNFIAG